MATQARQVFYVEDPSDARWSIELTPPQRDCEDQPNDDELGDIMLHCQGVPSDMPNIDGVRDDEDKEVGGVEIHGLEKPKQQRKREPTVRTELLILSQEIPMARHGHFWSLASFPLPLPQPLPEIHDMERVSKKILSKGLTTSPTRLVIPSDYAVISGSDPVGSLHHVCVIKVVISKDTHVVLKCITRNACSLMILVVELVVEISYLEIWSTSPNSKKKTRGEGPKTRWLQKGLVAQLEKQVSARLAAEGGRGSSGSGLAKKGLAQLKAPSGRAGVGGRAKRRAGVQASRGGWVAKRARGRIAKRVRGWATSRGRIAKRARDFTRRGLRRRGVGWRSTVDWAAGDASLTAWRREFDDLEARGEAGRIGAGRLGCSVKTSTAAAADTLKDLGLGFTLEEKAAFIIHSRSKKSILKTAGTTFRQFKHWLTKRHILPFKNELELLKRPPDMYCYIEKKSGKNLLDLDYVHILRTKENFKKRDERRISITIDFQEKKNIPSEESELDRASMWKKARVDKKG
ncbi:putative serine/threonine-protein kinase nek2 [Cucumis melo var. makuwa]|uniref:Serine/threonine-protein kinase nek2 n=1 Tax=Cucumis melo var. makuwa TaxID=1194695 RepID=A0A5A7U799_CUCMM|nr:putative serine/threonine-protein kinase nek2 [Cucumis melo var. makuwa]